MTNASADRKDQWDRLQALIRCPQYANDYKDLLKLKKGRNKLYSKKMEAMKKKWGIMFLVDPDEWKSKARPENVSVFADDPPAKQIPYKKESGVLKYLRENRYGLIQVDVACTADEVIKCIKPILQEYKTLMRTEKSREAKTLFDPWVIYDLHMEENLSFLDITRLVTGEIGNVSSKDELNAARKRVQSAYHEAVEMISLISR
jgi:hypothetical protein